MGISRLLKPDQTAKTMLDHILTEDLLRKQAGERYFERGRQYFRSGAVARVGGDGSGIAARVIGTEPYLARLWTAGRELRWGCSCPLGREGEFCKHLVAAGLAWLAGSAGDAEARAEHKRVQELLGPLDRQGLLELIADRAMCDEPFYEELLLTARAVEDRRERQANQGEPPRARSRTRMDTG